MLAAGFLVFNRKPQWRVEIIETHEAITCRTCGSFYYVKKDEDPRCKVCPQIPDWAKHDG